MDIPRLHPDTIEEVKNRVDIFDVISDYVVLRKKGKDYLGLCPFHEEKTPSFTVSQHKQFYYCFGCGAGGNAFKFLMELNKRSFAEVVLELAKRYQVPIKTVAAEKKQELQRELSLREQAYEILALTTSFFQHALRQNQGENALNYLKNQRGLTEETIQQFQLGYAPSGWDTLYHYLVEVKLYSVELLAQLGLVKKRKSGDGYYDQFRDRLIIPIHDPQGKVIGFGGRSLGDELPKYLNSPETILFNKSKTLFALDKARQNISKEDRAVVVEGYFDAISLHAAGITNVVASLGTALSQEQLKLLLRYPESKTVILNFDADKAGIKATKRAITEIKSLVYSGQVQLKILNLPDGKDADEFLKANINARDIYRECLDNAPLWLDWKIQQLLMDKNLKNATDFQAVVQEMLNLLSHLEDSNQRTHYISYCAEILSQDNSSMIPLYTQNLLTQLKKPRFKASTTTKVNTVVNLQARNLLAEAEELLLLIYLHCPQHRANITEQLEAKDLLFSFSHHRFLWQQILNLQKFSASDSFGAENKLLSLLQDKRVEFAEQIAQVEKLFYLDEKKEKDLERASLSVRSAIAAMEQVTCEKYRRFCLEKWRNINAQEDPENAQYYLQEFYQAELKIKELDKERNFSNLEIVYSE